MSIVPVAQPADDPDQGVSSKQAAEVTLPRAELERLWSPEYLERLARTYWRFLSRISLGLLRVLYTPASREVVVFARPFVLLSFRTPEYEMREFCGTVTWPIERGLLVAPSGRGRGYLRLTVRRPSEVDGSAEVTATISSEVVHFYPLLVIFGRGFYNHTQLRLHEIVTNAFLRSLANLELEPSAVGSLRPRLSRAAPPRSRAVSSGRDER